MSFEKKYWLVKSEPDAYSWDTFSANGGGMWDGVRNYQARNNLKAMQKGDLVYFYHSNIGLEIVGIAEVATEHYPDPSINDERWVAVDLVPIEKLKKTVSLKIIKADPELKDIALLKLSRLSVVPILKTEFDRILLLSNEF